MLRLLPVLFLLSACYAEELEQELQQDPFFDLAAYMDRQVDSLSQSATEVTKTITLNGTTETHELPALNFRNDLRVFRESDINKPAYRDKYRVEREESGGSLTRIYTATDSSMQTRRLTVVSRDSLPSFIEIIRKTGTVLSDGDHRLVYDPLLGYSMHTEQINTFGEDLNANIEVRWK
ncbi:hypothetical protein [Lewinella sp. IMCC34183]|uniref:hypothetical protein n=1 Tax=Lewinella sp. IMCC34183 TaxID=2248762 RepID=UPI000E2296C8|nr:hypothetical protein [Lewinella sp. IMCC34183]